jgi:predicted metal-dependent peptidase
MDRAPANSNFNTQKIMTKNELTLKLDRARWWILQNSPFYGQLCMGLTDVLGNPHGKTACTDGRRIFWDENFLAGLPDGETRFVVLHETLHCAHGHLWRFPAGAADHDAANQACDHAINLLLRASGLDCTMPSGGLADERFDGMAEEEIFTALAQRPRKTPGASRGEQPSAPADDPCGDFTAPAPDDGQDGQDGAGPRKTPGASRGEQPSAPDDTLRDKWDRAVIQAAQAAKAGRGDLPADLARQLEKLQAVQIDWRRETADFVKNAASSKNDWTRSPRRHAWQSVIYPRRKQNETGWIIGVRDTSGSIDDKLAAEFSAILAAACAELNCGLILIDCDSAIAAEYRIEAGGEVPLTAAGGGGTDFAAPFARAAELIAGGETLAGLVYLTDLDGTGQPDAEEIPTLWLCTNSNVGKTGRTVRIM